MVVQQKVWWTSEKMLMRSISLIEVSKFFMNSGTWTGPVVPYPVSGSKMSITVHDQRGFLSQEEDCLNIPLASGSSNPQGPSSRILPLHGYPVFWHKPWLQKRFSQFLKYFLEIQPTEAFLFSEVLILFLKRRSYWFILKGFDFLDQSI